MNVRIQILIAVLLIAALIELVNMIRRKSIELRYTLAWLVAFCAILVLDAFPVIISKAASVLGVGSPINILFFAGFCFSLLLIFILTIAVSKMSVQIKSLTQKMAMMEKRIRDNQEKNE